MVHHCHWHHVYVCAIGAAELNLAGQCKPAVVQKVNCMRAATSGPPRRRRRRTPAAVAAEEVDWGWDGNGQGALGPCR